MSKDFNFAYVHGGGNSSRIIKYNLNTLKQISLAQLSDGTNNPASSQATQLDI